MQQKFSNLVAMQEAVCKIYQAKPMYGQRGANDYEWTTYGEFSRLVDQFRGGLAALGVTTGDKVAVISKNSVAWVVGAYASYGLGAWYVPMYESQKPEEWQYILQDCGATVLLASAAVYAEVKNFPAELGSLKHVVEMDNHDETRTNSFGTLLKMGAAKPVIARHPDTQDPMGLIYTSGTTGNPKGVILSHGNIVNNVYYASKLLDLEGDDRTLCFLPWAHSFGQLAEVHLLIYCGYSAAFVQDLTTIIDDLAAVRPTVLISVPRIFNRIYDAVQAKMQDANALVRYLFTKGMEYAAKQKQGKLGVVEGLIHWVADRLVFKKIRDRFGGRLRFAVSGGSALSKEVAEFIDNLNIRVYEGYGLTETSPLVSFNSKVAKRIGSVGKPIEGVTVRLDTTVTPDDSDEGEIIVYGHCVMQGYYNLPEATKEVIDEDGGFHTGDLGRIDEDGFLYITGRIKELYKLTNGKYVAPAPLEEKLKLSPYITEVMLYGDNRQHNVALIVPSLDALVKYAEAHQIEARGAALLAHELIQQLYRHELDRHSASFKGFERPVKFTLLTDEWTTANGMLTQTLKLKRRILVKKYEQLINSLYVWSLVFVNGLVHGIIY